MNAKPSTNHTVDWDQFNAETYRSQYFIKPGKEDLWIPERIIEFLAEKDYQHNRFTRAADIGTGPSLVVPLVDCVFATHVDLVETAMQSVDYLRQMVSNEDALKKDWAHIENMLANFPGALPEQATALDLFQRRANVVNQRIQELLPDTYDFVTSVFCAESATGDIEECAEFIATILGSLKKGGFYAAAYIEGSEKGGYPDYQPDGTHPDDYDSQKFPQVNISKAWLEEQFKDTGIRVERCPFAPAIRAGYQGVLLAIGFK